MLQREQVFKRLLASFPRLGSKMYVHGKVVLKVRDGFVSPETVQKFGA